MSITKIRIGCNRLEYCLDAIDKLSVQYFYYVYDAKSKMALRIVLGAVLVFVILFYTTNIHIFFGFRNNNYLCR